MLAIFCNKNIKIGNKDILYKKWIKPNVCFVMNFVDANGRYLSFTEFKEKYGIDTNFLTSL